MVLHVEILSLKIILALASAEMSLSKMVTGHLMNLSTTVKMQAYPQALGRGSKISMLINESCILFSKIFWWWLCISVHFVFLKLKARLGYVSFFNSTNIFGLTKHSQINVVVIKGAINCESHKIFIWRIVIFRVKTFFRNNCHWLKGRNFFKCIVLFFKSSV